MTAVRNSFVVSAKSQWEKGGEKALSEYVQTEFGKISWESQNAIVVHLIKTICEREH